MADLSTGLKLVHEVLLFSGHVGSVGLDSEEAVPHAGQGWVHVCDSQEVGFEGRASLVLLEEDLEGIFDLVALELDLLESLFVIHFSGCATDSVREHLA